MGQLRDCQKRRLSHTGEDRAEEPKSQKTKGKSGERGNRKGAKLEEKCAKRASEKRRVRRGSDEFAEFAAESIVAEDGNNRDLVAEDGEGWTVKFADLGDSISVFAVWQKLIPPISATSSDPLRTLRFSEVRF